MSRLMKIGQNSIRLESMHSVSNRMNPSHSELGFFGIEKFVQINFIEVLD